MGENRKKSHVLASLQPMTGIFFFLNRAWKVCVCLCVLHGRI